MTDQNLKIVVVGDCGVGKTSLCRAIQKEKFSEVYIPTIADSLLTHWIYTIKTINLQIHDQSGDRKYKMICDSYYRSSNQFLVVFDLSDQKSFESVDYWVKNIRKYASDNINIYLVGTKGDLSTRQVTEEQMKSCASRLRLDVNIEVNSNTESGINDLSIRSLYTKRCLVEMFTLIIAVNVLIIAMDIRKSPLFGKSLDPISVDDRVHLIRFPENLGKLHHYTTFFLFRIIGINDFLRFNLSTGLIRGESEILPEK